MGVYSVGSPKRCNCSRWQSSDSGKPPPWHGSPSHRVPAVLLAVFVWVYGELGHQVCNQIYILALCLFIVFGQPCNFVQYVIKSWRIIQFSSFGPPERCVCLLFQPRRLFVAGESNAICTNIPANCCVIDNITFCV